MVRRRLERLARVLGVNALFYCTATTYAEATAMFPEAGGSSLFGKTVETALAERPCRVILESRPPRRA